MSRVLTDRPRFVDEDFVADPMHRAIDRLGDTPAFPSVLPLDEADTFAGPPDDQRRIDYLPTPDEIVDACASIRSQWSLSEKRRRFVGEYVHEEEDRIWQPPVIDTSHFRVTSVRVDATR